MWLLVTQLHCSRSKFKPQTIWLIVTASRTRLNTRLLRHVIHNWKMDKPGRPLEAKRLKLPPRNYMPVLHPNTTVTVGAASLRRKPKDPPTATAPSRTVAAPAPAPAGLLLLDNCLR